MTGWGAVLGGCSRTRLSPFYPGQVESFEGWIRAGSPTPREQLRVRQPHPSTPRRGCAEGLGGWWGPGAKPAGSDPPTLVPQRFQQLKDAQDALEQGYLRARQQHPEASGEFDPDR